MVLYFKNIIKAESFSVLNKMDSVMAERNSLVIIAEKVSDSLTIAYSLLLLNGEVDYVEHLKLLKYLPV